MPRKESFPMRLFRRICATAFVASVTLLGACGSDTATAPSTDQPNLAGTLEFTISNGSPLFVADLGAQPNPRTRRVFIGGLIAAASYPALGTPTFNPSANRGWLTWNSTPQFSRDPLGWNFDFTVDKTGLADGLYTAQIPVTVTGARNNPQMITVTLAVCSTSNCLFLGSDRPGEITVSSPLFNPNDPTPVLGGAKYFQEWLLFVLPGQSLYLHNDGASSGSGTMNDPYLYAWGLPGDSFYGSDDDAGCGVDAQLFFQNLGSVTQVYRIYTSHFSSLRTGTTRVRVNLTDEGSCGGGSLREGSVPAAWEQAYIAKWGHPKN